MLEDVPEQVEEEALPQRGEDVPKQVEEEALPQRGEDVPEQVEEEALPQSILHQRLHTHTQSHITRRNAPAPPGLHAILTDGYIHG